MTSLTLIVLLLMLPAVQLNFGGRKNNRKFGTIATPLSKVHLNPKPFVIIKKIDYQNLRMDNANLRLREQATYDKLTNLNTVMYKDYYKSWTSNMETFVAGQKHMVLNTGGPYNQSCVAIQNVMSQLQSERTLPIPWAPEIYNKTKREATREKRMVVMPIIAAVMSVAKVVAPTVVSSVLSHVTEAIAHKGMKKAPRALTKEKNYMQVKELPFQKNNMFENAPDFNDDPFRQDNAGYQYYYSLNGIYSGLFKHVEIVQRVNWELENLNMHRQMQTMRNENFVRDIMMVRNGQVPPTLLSPKDLQGIIDDISHLADKEKMNLDHIITTQNVYKIYPFLTPILLVDTESYEMIMLIIVPMVPSGTFLRLYKIETLPFMTYEGVAMQIALPHPYYISDLTGSHHALLSAAEYDRCTVIDDITICHVAKPVVTERSECYAALLYSVDDDNSIYRSCEFRKVDGRQHHFIYISPNTFAYFLPKPSVMILTCQGKDFQNVTMLPRSGTLRYEDRCSAEVDKRLFHDTSVELMNTSVRAQDAAMSFLTVAKGKWPSLITSAEEQQNLLLAAKDDVEATEHMASLSTRARVYHALKDLMTMSQEQIYLKEVYNHLFYFLTSLAVPIVLGILCSCYHKIFFKCQPKAHPPIPKPAIMNFRRGMLTINPQDAPIIKDSPNPRKRDLPPGVSTPAKTRKAEPTTEVPRNPAGVQNTYISAPPVDSHSLDIAHFQQTHQEYPRLAEGPVYQY
jgi:hypothetical protein